MAEAIGDGGEGISVRPRSVNSSARINDQTGWYIPNLRPAIISMPLIGFREPLLRASLPAQNHALQRHPEACHTGRPCFSASGCSWEM